MKKLTLLALAVLLILPGLARAEEGDPALYVDFGEDTHDLYAGQAYTFTLGPCNFGFVSGTCPDTDTFCIHLSQTGTWDIVADPDVGSCYLLDPGYLWWQDYTVTVPCEAEICDYDTLIAIVTYCDDTFACRTDIPDCEDPNWYGGNPYYSADTIILHVVEAPPALYILQDSLFLVSEGQTNAYVPFALCNGDPCAPPMLINYSITNKGHIPGNPGFPQTGFVTSLGGECENAYAVVDAGDAEVCDLDTLTIIVWVGTVYDTCVQLIHVVAPVDVPLFTAPVVTILVLAMILAAAVIMRKRAVSRA